MKKVLFNNGTQQVVINERNYIFVQEKSNPPLGSCEEYVWYNIKPYNLGSAYVVIYTLKDALLEAYLAYSEQEAKKNEVMAKNSRLEIDK